MVRPLTILLVSILLTACAAAPSNTQPPFYIDLSKGGAFDATAAASMINAYRRNEGLAPLALDAGLSSVAANESRRVAARQRSSGRVTPSRDLTQMVRNAGYDTKGYQRNISAGYYTIAEAFSGWRQSGQHRATMLSKSGGRMGIAAVNVPNAKYKVYWTLIVANKVGAVPAPLPPERS